MGTIYRKAQVVETNERPRFVNNKEWATICEHKREDHVVPAIKRLPGSGNKRERGRLCEQKGEGQVV